LPKFKIDVPITTAVDASWRARKIATKAIIESKYLSDPALLPPDAELATNGCQFDRQPHPRGTSERSMASRPLTPLRDEHFTAAVLGLSAKTLRRWRWLGKGPRYHKIGAAVRYADEDIASFLDAARRSNTGEAPS
jgi:hypothetical protein